MEPREVPCITVFGNVNIKEFWRRIINTVSNIIDKEVLVCPEVCILGLIPETLALRTHERKLVNLCLIHTKHLIARHWKSVHCPSLNSWIAELSSCIAPETYTIKRKTHIFHKIWDSFLKFLESRPDISSP